MECSWKSVKWVRVSGWDVSCLTGRVCFWVCYFDNALTFNAFCVSPKSHTAYFYFVSQSKESLSSINNTAWCKWLHVWWDGALHTWCTVCCATCAGVQDCRDWGWCSGSSAVHIPGKLCHITGKPYLLQTTHTPNPPPLTCRLPVQNKLLHVADGLWLFVQIKFVKVFPCYTYMMGYCWRRN